MWKLPDPTLRAALAIAACLTLTACGGVSADGIVEAGDRTLEERTARVALSNVIDGGVGGLEARTDMEGVVDFREGTAELELELGLPDANGAVQATRLVAVTDGTDAWVRPVTIGDQSAEWTLLPSDGQPAASGTPTGGVGTQLRLLAGGIGDVAELGTDDVRGAEAVHYRTEVDLPAAIEALGDDERAVVRQLADSHASDLLPMDVWIGDGLVRRLQYVLTLPEGAVAEVGQGATITTVIEYSDHGLPVDVELPDEVRELPRPAPSPSAEAGDPAA